METECKQSLGLHTPNFPSRISKHPSAPLLEELAIQQRPLFFWNLCAVSSLKQSPSFWPCTVTSIGNECPLWMLIEHLLAAEHLQRWVLGDTELKDVTVAALGPFTCRL